MSLIVFIQLLLFVLHHVDAGQSSCQDIDQDACVSMYKQNSNMCSDAVLSNTVCPAVCSKCPITCYNCNTTTTDISQCNTNTCSNGEMCLLKTVNDGPNPKQYTMMCGATTICSVSGKRNVSPYITIICCGQDLCNAPVSTTTTTTSTATTTTTQTQRATKPAKFTKPVQPTHTSHTTKTFWNQMQTTKSPGCKRDIIFMIEASIGMIPYFDHIKDGILGIINQLDVGLHDTRVALGTFNVVGTTHWGLHRYFDKVSLEFAVRSLKPDGFLAPLASNMAAVEHILNSFKIGNRPNIPDVIILLTEAHSENDWVFQALTGHTGNVAISQLHQRSHNVIAIAAGSANENLVQSIATGSDHYFHINDFPDWRSQHIDNKIMKMICL